jgi:hypothetical protein
MTRNATRMIGLAAMAGLGLHYAAAEDTVAGGGGADKKPEDKPADKKPEPKKIELTEEELAKRVADALATERKKTDDERERAKAEAAAEDARKKGEFEKLYQGEAGRVKELEGQAKTLKLDLRKKDAALLLQRHLAANHKDYVENDVDILPHVQFDADTTDDDLAKRIKDAAKAFVDRTPKASALSGVPAGAARGKLGPGTDIPKNPPDDKRATRPIGPTGRF